MSVGSQSAPSSAGELYSADLAAPLARLRRRLLLLGTLAVLGILLLLVLSNVLHGQQRRADLRIAEMISIAAEQSIATERLLRNLTYLESRSDGARLYEPLSPSLPVDHRATREHIRADIRQLRGNFAVLAADMNRRPGFASELRRPLADGRRQLDGLMERYSSGASSQGETIEGMLALGAMLEPLQRQLTAEYRALQVASLRQLQVQEGWARLGFIVLVVVLMSLLLMPALQEVRGHARKLARSRRQAGHIVSATRIGTWSYVVETRTFHVDRRWVEMLGYPQESMRTLDYQALQALLHPQDQPRLKQAILAVDEKPEQLHAFDFRMCHRSGDWVWIRSVVTVLSQDAHGHPLEIAGVNIDISEQVSQRLNLEQALEQAAAASRAKSAFLANMSHEIRTPLTSITGYADLLEDAHFRAQPALVDEAVQSIRGNAHHLLAVINDVLDMSRIEAGRMSVERIDVAPAAVVHDVVALLKPQATAKSLALSVHCHGELPRSVVSDPTRLRQILINLVGNAIKFTSQGAVTIELACQRDDEGQASLSFVVCDTGVGMSPDELTRVLRFAAFSQADDSMSRRFGGSGLGLSISHELARMLGGEIRGDSHQGHGSRFELALALGPWERLEMVQPTIEFDTAELDTALQSADVEAATIVPASCEQPPLAGRWILLAEDGPDNQRLIGYHLRRAGASLVICDNGLRALEALARCRAEGRRVDLLVSDIQMPEMDGYALVRSLRDAGETLPILALTAHALEQDRRQCLAAGFDDFASKPIRSPELVAKCLSLIVDRDCVTRCYTSHHVHDNAESDPFAVNCR
ncbi:MAG: response regulator [Gammaproteobacteria bacterium]|nr:response regulator [Gammaproteobacteria bacterium]